MSTTVAHFDLLRELVREAKERETAEHADPRNDAAQRAKHRERAALIADLQQELG